MMELQMKMIKVTWTLTRSFLAWGQVLVDQKQAFLLSFVFIACIHIICQGHLLIYSVWSLLFLNYCCSVTDDLNNCFHFLYKNFNISMQNYFKAESWKHKSTWKAIRNWRFLQGSWRHGEARFGSDFLNNWKLNWFVFWSSWNLQLALVRELVLMCNFINRLLKGRIWYGIGFISLEPKDYSN